MGLNVSGVLPSLRLERGLTQEQLGAKARISRTDIVAFESGAKTVGDVRLRRLADALEVSLVDLGAAEEEDDTPARQSILGRLEELAEAVAEVLENQEAGLLLLAEIRAAIDSGGATGRGHPTRRPR